MGGGVVACVVGGDVGGGVAGADGAEGADGAAAGGALAVAPVDAALGAGDAAPEAKVVADAGAPAAVVGAGGAPAGGTPAGVAAAAAAVVGVLAPLGFVPIAAARFIVGVMVAGAFVASTATITNVALALSPVANKRLAAAGRDRRAISRRLPDTRPRVPAWPPR